MASVITVDLGPGAEKAKETFEKYSSFVVGNAAKDIADSAMQRTAESAKAEIELIISTIEENVQAVIENGADALYKSLGINEETMQFAKNMVSIANSGLTLIGSKVLQGILLINKFDSMSIPMNVLAAGLQMIASFADLYYKAFIEAYGVYIDLIIEFIIDPGIALEILNDLIDMLLKKIYDLIDEQCYKYLGMTLAQLYYYCRKGMQLYKDYKEARKKRKEQQQQEEEEHREGITASGSKKTVHLNADIIKDNLFNWLKQQRDSLFNGFLIIQVLDAVKSIQEMIKTLTDVNLETLADNINSLDDLVNMLEDLGLGDDSTAIDLSLIPKLNLNDIYAGLNNLNISSTLTDAATLGASSALAAARSTKVSTQKTYDITTDAENKIITMKFYDNPTKSSISRNIYKLLSGAKGADGKELFSAAECKLIQDNIRQLYNDNETSGSGSKTVQTFKYTINIQLQIEKKEDKSAAASGDKTVDDSYKDEQDGPRVELAVMEEEYHSFNYVEKKRTETRRNTIALLHTVFSILKSVIPSITELAKLIQNYKINKAYVLGNSQQDLFSLYKETMAKLGLDKTMELDSDSGGTDSESGSSTTMYTVRALSLYNFINDEMKIIPSSTAVTFPITKTQADEINNKITELNDGSPKIDTSKNNIMLYIDYASIRDERRCRQQQAAELGQLMDDSLVDVYIDCQSKHKNGSFDNMENLEVVGNTIIYSDKNLPRMGSQIMMAKMRGFKP